MPEAPRAPAVDHFKGQQLETGVSMSEQPQRSGPDSDPRTGEPTLRRDTLARGQQQQDRGDSAPQVEDTTQASALMFEFVKQLAKELSYGKLDLPTLPSIVMRMKAVLEDENSTAETIARVAGSEPALAARLLKMANSAAFSHGGIEVTDLKSAVSRLGRDLIRTSAMSFAMQNLMAAQTVAQLKPQLSALWKHSITVAAMANAIGKRVEGVNADEAMFIGLIHDIGKLYILSRIANHPDLFACPEAMEQLMSEWHAEIGKSIVESWAFPDHVAAAVSEHGDMARHKHGPADLLDVLIAANLLANKSERDGCDQLDFDAVSAFSRLKIDAGSVEEFITESREEIDALMGALRG